MTTDHHTTDASEKSHVSRRTLLGTIGAVVLTGTMAGCQSGGSQSTDPGSVETWLAETDSFDGVVDRTGQPTVVVSVGANGNGGANAFAPVAVAVTPGTTVRWEWVDGYHNVVDTAGEFDSGEPETDATFEYTFREPGEFTYSCEPHESMGMKGAIVVRSEGPQ